MSKKRKTIEAGSEAVPSKRKGSIRFSGKRNEDVEKATIALFEAAYRGDEKEFKLALSGQRPYSGQADVMARNAQGETALHIALKKGMDDNDAVECAVSWILRKKTERAHPRFIDCMSADGRTLLDCAAMCEDKEQRKYMTVELLKIDELDPFVDKATLSKFEKAEQEEILKRQKKWKEGGLAKQSEKYAGNVEKATDALFKAVEDGDEDAFKQALAGDGFFAEADVTDSDTNYITALHAALRKGMDVAAEAVKAIERGKANGVYIPFIDHASLEGRTLLDYAAMCDEPGRSKSTEALLKLDELDPFVDAECLEKFSNSHKEIILARQNNWARSNRTSHKVLLCNFRDSLVRNHGDDDPKKFFDDYCGSFMKCLSYVHAALKSSEVGEFKSFEALLYNVARDRATPDMIFKEAWDKIYEVHGRGDGVLHSDVAKELVIGAESLRFAHMLKHGQNITRPDQVIEEAFEELDDENNRKTILLWLNIQSHSFSLKKQYPTQVKDEELPQEKPRRSTDYGGIEVSRIDWKAIADEESRAQTRSRRSTDIALPRTSSREGTVNRSSFTGRRNTITSFDEAKPKSRVDLTGLVARLHSAVAAKENVATVRKGAFSKGREVVIVKKEKKKATKLNPRHHGRGSLSHKPSTTSANRGGEIEPRGLKLRSGGQDEIRNTFV